MIWMIASIVLGTLLSEDLACISAGLLVHRGHLAAGWAVGACVTGIYGGDVGLWLAGRWFGRRALESRWVSRKLTADRAESIARWLDEHCASAVLGSRFVPGTRLPTYVAAGVFGRRAGAFLLWALVAALLWTPAVVLAVAIFGEPLVAPLRKILGVGPWSLAATALGAFVAVRGSSMLVKIARSAGIGATISRVRRWEFWPAWVFYAPILPWILLKSLWENFMMVTVANPGIAFGGFVGESKHQILTAIRGPQVLPHVLLRPGDDLPPLTYPVILKPDAGQRGAGVKLVRSPRQAMKYLAHATGPVIAQTFHPGPFEAGVFYYRLPGEPTGHIFSVTDKVFPQVIGNGISSLKELILHHPRYRMQFPTFASRHRDNLGRVPAAGEQVKLALAGNHCQGTMFRDGAHLITPQLERAIDAIARRFDGFCFGRFDVRYSDPEAFKAGQDLAVVELNGITSESTNIYDPSRSLVWAYRTLIRQWEILFEIGRRNRRLGCRPATPWSLLKTIIAFYRTRDTRLISD